MHLNVDSSAGLDAERLTQAALEPSSRGHRGSQAVQLRANVPFRVQHHELDRESRQEAATAGGRAKQIWNRSGQESVIVGYLKEIGEAFHEPGNSSLWIRLHCRVRSIGHYECHCGGKVIFRHRRKRSVPYRG